MLYNINKKVLLKVKGKFYKTVVSQQRCMGMSVGYRIRKRRIKTKVAEMKTVRSRGMCGVIKSSRTRNRLHKKKFRSNGRCWEMGKKIDRNWYVCMSTKVDNDELVKRSRRNKSIEEGVGGQSRNI